MFSRSSAFTGPYGTVDVFSKLLATLLAERVHIAVLPEAISRPHRVERAFVRTREIARRSILCWSSPGSHTCREALAHTNEAVVLDGFGREVLRHEKLEPYTDPKLGIENIVPRTSEDYSFPRYRRGTNPSSMCAATFGPTFRSSSTAFSEGTIFLVPAYSERLDFVADEAPVLGQRQLAITAAAANDAATGGLRDALYFYAPVRGDRYRKGTLLPAEQAAGASSGATATTFRIWFSPGRRAELAGPVVFPV